jgi:hypothetical protein
MFRHKKRPLEIQRTLGMRRSGFKMPGFLAGPVANLISLGLDDSRSPAQEKYGCLMILARKR